MKKVNSNEERAMKKEKRKRPYEKPRAEDEKVFEQLALACGKCAGAAGPVAKVGCGALPSSS